MLAYFSRSAATSSGIATRIFFPSGSMNSCGRRRRAADDDDNDGAAAVRPTAVADIVGVISPVPMAELAAFLVCFLSVLW